MEEERVGLAHRLALLGRQIYNACRMGGWCFRLSDKHLFFSTFPYERELKLFLEASGTLESAIAMGGRGEPVIFTDPLGLLWIAETGILFETDKPLLFLLGPVFLTNVSNQYIKERMAHFKVSPVIQGRYMRILQEVPVLDSGMVEQYAKMLHSTIVDDFVPNIEITYASVSRSASAPDSADGPTLPYAGAKTDYLRAYQLEQDILSAVREGRADALKRLSYPGVLYQFRTKDPLREVKNNIIIFISLCARAAVEGGVSLQVAKEMEEDYIFRAEECNIIADLAKLNHEMVQDFSEHVAQCRENPGISDTIQSCCNYIRHHYMEPLELSDISSALGYTDYYLSRKFHKEMGIHISDYINEVRLGHAKVLLSVSNLTLESISERLQYNSRNYFSKVFRKHFGISPSEYRAALSRHNEKQEGESS